MPVQPHCPGQPGTQSLQPSRPTLSLAPRSTPSALQTAPPVPVLSQRRTVPGWGFLHCCSDRAQPALRSSGHRPLTGTQGLQIASQDFSVLRKQPPGNLRPLALPLGAAAANTTLPSSRGPSTCSCTPTSSSCGPPPAVALPPLNLQSTALLTPDCRVLPPVSESAELGEDPKCCLTMNHTLSSTGHHA